MIKRKNEKRIITIVLLLILFMLILLALSCGRIKLSLVEIVKSLSHFSSEGQEFQKTLGVMKLRIPRVFTALLIGAALSSSGAVYQGIFKNPLVAPDFLGVSSGACVGASLAIIFNFSYEWVQLMAFTVGLIAVTCSTRIPKIMKKDTIATLVLAGLIVRGFLDSIMGLIKYIADPETQLATIAHWQLGSLMAINNKTLLISSILILLCLFIIYLLRWQINLLSLGEEEAKTLGVNIFFLKSILIVCATVLTASSVCISGTIGWIGLVTPHFARLIFGNDNQDLIPASIILGSIFLLLTDTLARSLTSQELPLSVITGFIGAPCYFLLLLKQRMNLE